MSACIDASFALARLLPDERDDTVLVLWRDLLREERLIAPPLMWAEVTSAIRRAGQMGRLPPANAAEAIAGLVQLPITMVTDLGIYPRALQLAERLDLGSAYDMQYLAVAELQGCPVVTLDRSLYQRARTLGIAARLLP